MTFKEPSKEEITRLLQQHEIMPTQQRVEIAQMLLAQPQHVSADQVLQLVGEKGNTTVCKATVYNTLGLFADKGLIRELIIDSSKVFYDSNTSGHHHFFNADTGKLSDIAESGLSISQPPDLPEGTVMERIDIVVRVRNRSE